MIATRIMRRMIAVLPDMVMIMNMKEEVQTAMIMTKNQTVEVVMIVEGSPGTAVSPNMKKKIIQERIADKAGTVIPRAIHKLHKKAGNIVAAVHKVVQEMVAVDKRTVDMVAGSVIPKVIQRLREKVGNIVVAVRAVGHKAAQGMVVVDKTVDKIAVVVGMAILKVIQKLHEKVGNIAVDHKVVVHKAVQGMAAVVDKTTVDTVAGLEIQKVIHKLHKKVGNIAAVVRAVAVHAAPIVAIQEEAVQGRAPAMEVEAAAGLLL